MKNWIHEFHPPEKFSGAWVSKSVKLGADVTLMPGAVVGRPPVSSGATARAIDATPQPTIIGDGTVIGSNAVIYSGVTVGQNSMVCDTACIREGVTIGDKSIVAMGVTVNYNTRIGNRVKIMDNTHVTGNAIIEDDVFIAMLVTMANDNHMGKKVPGKVNAGPTIRKGARIGQGACLHPGIEIGEGAVVAANSVVTRNVPPNTVVVGTPARPMRKVDE